MGDGEVKHNRKLSVGTRRAVESGRQAGVMEGEEEDRRQCRLCRIWSSDSHGRRRHVVLMTRALRPKAVCIRPRLALRAVRRVRTASHRAAAPSRSPRVYIAPSAHLCESLPTTCIGARDYIVCPTRAHGPGPTLRGAVTMGISFASM